MSERKSNQKVVAFIIRDARNRPFVKLCYDFGDGLKDAYKLMPAEISQASYIFHKTTFLDDHQDVDLVKLNPITGVVYSDADRERLTTPSFVTGSEPGIDSCRRTIEAISLACADLDVMIPFYISAGEESIFLNEVMLEQNEGNNIHNVEIDSREYYKHKTLDNMLLGKKDKEMQTDDLPDNKNGNLFLEEI